MFFSKALIKKKGLAIFCFLSIITLEMASRLTLPDTKLDILESVSQVLEEDRMLFWRQRPHLNTKFQGVDISTNNIGFRGEDVNVNKNNQTYRIICLGASPTFGWGVESSNTYPFILEQKLKRDNLFKNIEVINAGQIGYTSYQGIILLERYLLRFSPDLITVSYVLNDIDRYKFYKNTGVSDKELIPGNSFAVKIKNIISKSRFYLVFKRIIRMAVNKNIKLSAGMFKKQFELAKVRVSPDDYKKNLEKIIDICRIHNVKIIFIKMPINLSLPHLTDNENDILKRGDNLSKVYYNLACKYEKNKDYENAHIFFKKAKDYIVFECVQDGVDYQKTMGEIAYKYNIPMADAAKIFSFEKASKKLFNIPYDLIHPNSEGHRIIAEAIYKEVVDLIQ